MKPSSIIVSVFQENKLKKIREVCEQKRAKDYQKHYAFKSERGKGRDQVKNQKHTYQSE